MISMVIKLTVEEWQAEGIKRFGSDNHKWKFACPICGNVAAVEDFRPFKDRGATANSATCECIGRYTGVDGFRQKGNGPCDYAGYGLFQASPVRVDSGGCITHCFAFADPDPSEAGA
jgi:hypothetical protein